MGTKTSRRIPERLALQRLVYGPTDAEIAVHDAALKILKEAIRRINAEIAEIEAGR